jgi:hypothetical protein
MKPQLLVIGFVVLQYMFVKAYNETKEHGAINGLTPSEMFLQTFNRSHNRNNTKQKSVTHVGNQNCYLSV